MSLWNSKTYRNDVAKALSSVVDIHLLKSKRILITGASGLVCSAIVDILLYYNIAQDAKMTIYAAGRNAEKIKSRYEYGLNNGLRFVEYDATKCVDWNFSIDYIIHGASNASPDKYVAEPVDTMLANISGVGNLLKYVSDTSDSCRVVYISSSEVYGTKSNMDAFSEDDYGYIDTLSVRSSYSMGKRASETLCISYAQQYGVNVSIVRPGHIYGPTSQNNDNRVSSLFARQAAFGESLVMKSEGKQLRSYCHCLDCASAILTVLLKGENMQAYNISNRDSVITIREMAEIIAKSAGVQLSVDVPTDVEKMAFNPMDNSSLNSEKLEKLGWQGHFNAIDGFSRTIKVLREIKSDDF